MPISVVANIEMTGKPGAGVLGFAPAAVGFLSGNEKVDTAFARIACRQATGDEGEDCPRGLARG